MLRILILGLCTAAVLTFTGVEQVVGATAPIQQFTALGLYGINAGTCWDDGTGLGQHPANVGGRIVCGSHTSDDNTPVGVGTTARRSFSFVQVPAGNRLTSSFTYTPSAPDQFVTDLTKADCGTSDAGICSSSSVTGTVSLQSDLLCNGANTDVWATAKSGIPTSWPDDSSDGTGWIGFDMRRTADDGVTGAPGGVNAYVNLAQPFPASFGFVSLDTASITKLFLGGGGAGYLVPSPSALQFYAASSPYSPEPLNVSNVVVGSLWGWGADPALPPKNDYLCVDSPQSMESSTEYLVPPTTDTLTPRWVTFASAPDFVNGAVGRIVDLQCLGTGTVTATAGGLDDDADDDCLTPAQGDTNDLNPDQDGDGLVDGVEFYAGSTFTPGACAVASNPASDCDLDGATDFEELFNFTNPNTADTDGDGSLDRADNLADENPATLAAVDDTAADDNCPATANATQTNTDSRNRVTDRPNGDATNPNQDAFGDACDRDDDNDGMTDTAESSFGVVTPWLGPGSTSCVGASDPTATQLVSLDPLNPDTDGDLYLDGIVCMMGGRPDIASTAAPFDCVSMSNGCARPKAAAVGEDPDGDGLYGSGILHEVVENFFRTQSINAVDGSQINDLDGDTLVGAADRDSDGDGLQDGLEVRFYGTSPANADTDGDGCSDGKEAASVDGDRAVSSGDMLLVALHYGAYRDNVGIFASEKAPYDINRDGQVNPGDSATVAFVFGACGAQSGSSPASTSQ